MDQEVNLSGRQLLVFEACQKVIKGKEMIASGLLELRNLVPESRPILANKILRSPGLRKSSKTDESVIADIFRMIDAGEEVSANYIHRKLGITETRVRKIREKMRGMISISKSKSHGNARLWRRPSNPSKSDGHISEKILDIIKNNSYVTIHMVMSKLGLSWNPASRELRDLADNGIIKSVRKINPANKNNREYLYWEVV